MAIYNYKCTNCEKIDLFFDYEIRDNKITCSCGNNVFKRLLSVPLDNKITESTKDYYTNANIEKGVQEDLKKRSKKHCNDTVRDTHVDLIERFGEIQAEKIMKESGFLISDDNGKNWRYRNDWDTSTLNSQNQGTIKPKLGGK